MIWYLHDDSETLTDAVTLQLTDGRHSVQRSAKVTVLPINDQEPQLLRFTHTQSHTHTVQVCLDWLLLCFSPPTHLLLLVLRTTRGQ